MKKINEKLHRGVDDPYRNREVSFACEQPHDRRRNNRRDKAPAESFEKTSGAGFHHAADYTAPSVGSNNRF